MLLNYNFLFVLLLLSTALINFMAIYIGRMKNKQQIHYAFFSTIVLLLIWSVSRLVQIFVQDNQKYVVFLEQFVYVGVILVPISLLYTGVIFAKTRIEFSYKHLLLFVIPIISLILVFTNSYHHLFIVKYSLISTGFVYGKYYIIHEIYSYLCILVGLYYLLYFSIKNSGFFSKQSILIFLGILFPLLVVVLSTQEIVEMPIFIENISFSFAMICFAFAIFKFNFLNVMPIALQRVVDLISDGFIVIGEDFKIIDYNKTLVDELKGIANFNRKDNVLEIINSSKLLNIEKGDFQNIILRVVQKRKSFSFEEHIIKEEFDKYFTIEITPIYNQDTHIGTIILFKDITQHKNDIELINQTQHQLVERERLASLGELTAGMAHEINTPLSAIQSNLFQLKAYLSKSKSGIQNNIEQEELLKLINGMDDVVQKADNTSKKIAAIINSVRNNTRNLSGENVQVFELGSIVNDLKIMLAHQLKTSGCEMTYTEDSQIQLKGDPGKLGQVLTNFIVNAMQAYEETAGAVEVKAENKLNEVVISVRDYGKGIPSEIKDRIFKEMLSTKGAQGTGLGMYISNSIISGNFGGRTWIESEEGKGTTVFVAIPKHKNE